MTCIAAIARAGRVYMGADTAMTDADDDSVTRCESKIFRAGGFLVGYCGSTEYCHALRYRLRWPANVDDADRHMATSLPDELRAVYQRAGLDIATHDGGAIVGYAGRLYWLDDFSCEPIVESYGAAGSGGLGARCVLAATAEWQPRKRLQRALEAAARHCASVRGPFDFLALP